ncbi:GbpC/Spa domain-containing protein [Streptococcus sp. NLN76]|uniref:GbpC/Spa domain-containing protein n=1 Tax=Streptococcus sp. NLN76 TaxID=2822800 RepID=UPI0018ABF4F0|nr:GbpC/Spa domain-containing protein [Streptococcus sp. NLN76]
MAMESFLKRINQFEYSIAILPIHPTMAKKITRLDYTYELLSTFAEDGKATAFIYTDPTKTIYVGTHGNNKGQIDFSIRQTMTYYFEDGSPVIFDKDKTALLSFASRNNSFEFGEQEFVQLESNLSFIPITGSSVSGEQGYVAARGSNNAKADGSKFDRSEWDQDGHLNEYYGAGVALVTGGEISFTFGIRYNPNDINRSANPSKLRDRSRQWFTVNADIKASGLINTEKPGNPPVAPTKPNILNKTLEAPSKPVQPTEPTYSVSNKPTAPKKPILKEIPSLPPLAVKAIKPTLPKAPVVFLHQVLYKVPPTAITIIVFYLKITQ